MVIRDIVFWVYFLAFLRCKATTEGSGARKTSESTIFWQLLGFERVKLKVRRVAKTS